MIALGYSKSAQRIAESGYQLAKAMNARPILLHVMSDTTVFSYLKYSPIIGFDSFSAVNVIHSDSAEQLEIASYKYLEEVKRRLDDETIQTVVKSGECGDTISRTATELSAEVIVMGTHGRRGLEKLFLGSVAENVLRHSAIPVFIIPIKIIDEKYEAVEINDINNEANSN